MLGLCQASGCCIAPLWLRSEGAGQGEDTQLSYEDLLDFDDEEKFQVSLPEEEVISFALMKDGLALIYSFSSLSC